MPGGSSEHPERLLTAFLYKYDQSLWPRCFDAHAVRGYRQWILWWPNFRTDGGSIQDFVRLCSIIKGAGFRPQVGLNSKDFDPRDQSAADWAAQLDPLFDALGAAGVADEFAVWEWDAHNVPGQPTIDAFRHFGQRAHEQGATFWAHFLPGHSFWDPRDRFSFWQDLGADVDGLDYQASVDWDIGLIQAHAVDVLNQFAQQGNVHKLRMKELKASLRFSGPITEEQACAFGFLACCTRANAPAWGYGDGGRNPDGSPL